MSTVPPAGGHSGTPLAKKIGIKAGDAVRLLHRPDHWQIPDLPAACTVTDDRGRSAAVTLAFYRSLAGLSAEAAGLVEDLGEHAMLWIAWPRRAAGHRSDVTDNALRGILLPLGVVDVKVAALGDDWSGLKFVRRAAPRRSGPAAAGTGRRERTPRTA